MTQHRRKLSEKQRYAIKLLTEFPRNERYDELAVQIGISSSTLRRWRNENEMFIQALEDRINELA